MFNGFDFLEEALQSILKIDRKLLEALLKLTPTDKESLEPVSTSLGL